MKPHPPEYAHIRARLIWSRRVHFLLVPFWLMLFALAMSIRDQDRSFDLTSLLVFIAGVGYVGSAVVAFLVLGACPHCGRNFYAMRFGRANIFALRCMRCGKEPHDSTQRQQR